MRIAQVAPLFESVPPFYYGGTERVVSYLTEELVTLGHDVTLFASEDSLTSAELVPCCKRGLRLMNCLDPLALHVTMLERVAARVAEFDLIHYHVDYLHFGWSRRHSTPHLTTLHGRLDLPELQAVYDEFPDMPVVSISQDQRRPLPQAHWVGTVHHGLPRDLHRANLQPGGYLAFLGRISPEKRVDRAIEIAKRTGIPLKIAAKVDRSDRDYFEDRIRHLLRHPLIEFVGEIGEHEKGAFLGDANALLFPIDWPEPFGLVMIEAMACGTPVVAFRMGSVPEVLEEGVSGFMVDDLDAAVSATLRAVELDRARCREAFERRFTATHMAKAYVDVFCEHVRRSVSSDSFVAGASHRYTGLNLG